jgi:ubiquinone/menaquinone biosynthesis C-methylase UbiE
MPDLHAGFGAPQPTISPALVEFLENVDRLDGIQAIHRAIRRAINPQPGMRVLDAGCGIGLEVRRLATEYPAVEFTGLDRNAAMLAAARQRAVPPPPNLAWVHAALEGSCLPEHHFDVVRTERVLIYLSDPVFDHVLDNLVRLLRPGGSLVLFELDYGATLLPAGKHDVAVVRRVNGILEQALPQPWAGRRLPATLSARGLDVTAQPYSFAVGEKVWRSIVHDTVCDALSEEIDPSLRAWLDDHSSAAIPFYGAFTGVLTTARRLG